MTRSSAAARLKLARRAVVSNAYSADSGGSSYVSIRVKPRPSRARHVPRLGYRDARAQRRAPYLHASTGLWHASAHRSRRRECDAEQARQDGSLTGWPFVRYIGNSVIGNVHRARSCFWRLIADQIAAEVADVEARGQAMPVSETLVEVGKRRARRRSKATTIDAARARACRILRRTPCVHAPRLHPRVRRHRGSQARSLRARPSPSTRSAPRAALRDRRC